MHQKKDFGVGVPISNIEIGTDGSLDNIHFNAPVFPESVIY